MVEIILHWLGGLLAYATLAVIAYGIWLGTRRPSGRTSGRAASWLRSGLFYLLATTCFLVISIYFWRPLPFESPPEIRLVTLFAGSVIYFPGMAFVLWGRLALGRMYFVSTSFGAQLFSDHKLVMHGPFAIVRNPMYLGLMTAALGALLLYMTWTTLGFAVLTPFILMRTSREEQALEAEFGEEWQEYCRRVPALLPRFCRGGKESGKTKN
jgi:protein-S-isoprenylcysteine O-methyltransferase Ste14